jgi:CheY-like chemotaxis protein/class 3 adenylate cyclase
MTPQENFNFINNYLSQMEPLIDKYNGFIDKYIGDAIMALFPNQVDNAVQASITMLNQLITYNETQKSLPSPLRIGIGIHSGPLMLGTVGGQNRMDGTVISDAVNLASRIESLTKIYGTPLLITEQTYQKLADPAQYHIRVIDAVKVKGKSEMITVYEVYDAQPQYVIDLKDKSHDNFQEGFVQYHRGQYEEAQAFFEQVLQINKNDKAAQVYLERCQQILSLRMPVSPRILIVDDTAINARLLSHILQKNQFQVSIANNGKSALEQAKLHIPHLILLDIMMPGMDGYEVCQHLKADSKTHDIPVIFMSALSEAADKVKGFEAGAVDYITKPFQHEEVLARLHTHLKLVHLQRQLKDRNEKLETNNLELEKKLSHLVTHE